MNAEYVQGTKIKSLGFIVAPIPDKYLGTFSFVIKWKYYVGPFQFFLLKSISFDVIKIIKAKLIMTIH